jgi:hypothetical protein
MAGYLRFLLFIFCQNVEVLEFHLFVISANVFGSPFRLFILAETLDQNLVVKFHLFNLLVQRCFRLRLGEFLLELVSSLLTRSKCLFKLTYLSISHCNIVCGNDVHLTLTVFSVDHESACAAHFTGSNGHPKRLAA